jgi:hypothetical protein
LLTKTNHYLFIKPEPEKEKYKVGDTVTVDKKHSNNDIQRSEEDNN